MHEAEQAERPERDGLAAGVRARDDERGVAVAQPDVDRDDAAGQARVSSRQQDRLGPVGGLGPAGAHLRGQRRLGDPQVEARQRVQGLAQWIRVGRDERRQLVEDPRDLLRLGDLRLPPGIAQLDRDERLDEERLAAARRVVDDALHPVPGLGLDRDDVPPVAERDDRLLERRAELRADQRVQPAPQPVVGDANGRAQAAETRRGRIEQLADRIEAARQRRAQRGQRVEVRPDLAQERPPLVGQERGQPGRGVEGRRDLEELARLQPAAARGSLDGRADVVGRADADARPVLDERPGLVGLVEAARDDDRVVRRLDRLRQAARGRERGGRREPCLDGRELEETQGALVHRAGQRPVAGPDADRWPRSTNRNGRPAHGSPA